MDDNNTKKLMKKIYREIELMNPEEFDDWIKTEFHKDFSIFRKIWEYWVSLIRNARGAPEIDVFVKQLRHLYRDLFNDGIFKLEAYLQTRPILDEYKKGQSAQRVAKNIDLALVSNKSYKKSLDALNESYKILYEFVCKILRPMARGIDKRAYSCGKVFETMREYRNGEYNSLFDSLIPQIKNSISHEDYLIDNKKAVITFFDKHKKSLPLPLHQYRDIFYELFCLWVAFGIVDFDLRAGFTNLLIKYIENVDEYLKEHNLKLVPAKRKGHTIFEIGKAIERMKFAAENERKTCR